MSEAVFDAFNELDDEIKQEFYEDVQSAVKDVNECVVILESGADAEVIDRMFRALHTVKGNCNMVFLDPFVRASHKLEDLFSVIRSGEIDYHDVYGSFSVSAVNAIKAQLDSLVSTGHADIDKLKRLECIVDTIEEVGQQSRQALCEKAIIAIEDGHYNLNLVSVDHARGHAFSFLDATDSEFFQFIVDKQSIVDGSHNQFMLICETIALKLNAMLGRSVDQQQLKAALNLVGLSKVIAPKTNPIDLTIDQIFFSSGLLSRMAGWGIASELVLQLKENHDGSGAPLGLKDEQILPAAQVIALSFEFTFLVMNHISESYKSVLFNAVKVINAQKDQRYKGKLIERFNRLIKGEYLTQQMW